MLREHGATRRGSQSSWTRPASVSEIRVEMNEVKTSFSKLDSSVNQIREEFRKLRLEIDQIKLDMCTKEQFSRLEVRVQKLEVQGPKNPQIDFLKQNLLLTQIRVP